MKSAGTSISVKDPKVCYKRYTNHEVVPGPRTIFYTFERFWALNMFYWSVLYMLLFNIFSKIKLAKYLFIFKPARLTVPNFLCIEEFPRKSTCSIIFFQISKMKHNLFLLYTPLLAQQMFVLQEYCSKYFLILCCYSNFFSHLKIQLSIS